MKIEEIEDKKTWDTYFDENGSPSFLQSWEWGELQKVLEYEVLRLGIYSSSDPAVAGESRSSRPDFTKASTGKQARTLNALAQIIKTKSKRGNFLFLPHGPIFQSAINNQQLTIKSLISQLLNFLISLARKENFTFIRIAPILEYTLENQKIFSDLGFKKAPIYMHAERLWLLNLTSEVEEADVTSAGKTSEVLHKTDEQLLAQMRKTTRYLIRKAQRDGVVIEKRTDEKAVDVFYEIYQETAKRENFVPFSKGFIEKEFKAFNKTGNAIFLFGSAPKANSTPEVENLVETSRRDVSTYKYCASALIIFTKSTAFYHQGASIHTKIPVTYLLQWEAIKEARKRGCQFYNFWGIHQEGRTPKSWGGLTLFKQGFGGQQVDYLPTQDYIISPKYYLTYFYEKYLRWRRGI